MPSWRLFSRMLTLFLLLGVCPTLLIAVVFALPIEWQPVQYRTFVGLLLILSTISTLCLAGLVTRILKHPINQLLQAQGELERGNFSVRLSEEGSVEMCALFHGFNAMVDGLRVAAEREKEWIETRSFSTLAAQVVHDIRSPLTSLRTAAAHFERTIGNDPAHADGVKLLALGVQRLHNIAEELLAERKRHETPKMTMVEETLVPLIAEVRQRQLNGLTILTDFFPTSLHIPIKAIDLQRAVGNILTNAIEAMHGVGTIRIATAVQGKKVYLTVTDTGPGMSPDILAKVLQGGFTHGKENGNGVGMTVVRTIVEKSGGSLHAESVVGRGTTFSLQFPLVEHP